jgi:hypothetical protein
MTSVGRLSLMAETKENPLMPTLLLALVGKPFHKEDFEQLWKKRGMPNRHPRFHQKIQTSSSEDPKDGSSGVFVPTELPVAAHVQEHPFPKIYNLDLQRRLQSFLTVPMKVQELLWEVEVLSGGQIGQSGAIPKDRAAELSMEYNQRNETEPTESILLVRGHEALADGISLAAAFIDLCDEAAELKEEMRKEMEEEKREVKRLRWWQKLSRLLHLLYHYSFGSLIAFWKVFKMYRQTSENPFQQIERLENTTTHGKRTLSWARVAPVEEVKQVAKSLTKKNDVSINDVIVSCVSAAVARQMNEHQMEYEMSLSKKENINIPNRINVVVPVHSEGGLLKEGQTVGHHRLGAFFASVPSDLKFTAAQRLEKVHASLNEMQQTPLVMLSRVGARVLSLLPVSWATGFLQTAQPNAAFMVTNARGPSRRIHFGGREVEVSQGFVALPPGVPIGVSISTYAGNLNISVTAEPWAVPDAEKFLSWILDEYKFLYTESPVALQPV